MYVCMYIYIYIYIYIRDVCIQIKDVCKVGFQAPKDCKP